MPTTFRYVHCCLSLFRYDSEIVGNAVISLCAYLCKCSLHAWQLLSLVNWLACCLLRKYCSGPAIVIKIKIACCCIIKREVACCCIIKNFYARAVLLRSCLLAVLLIPAWNLMALELLKIDCFIYANCFNICLYMPTILYMHSESSCKLINHISSIAYLNCQQIGFISYHIVNMVLLMLVFYHIVLINGFISWNTLAAALNYTVDCYFYTTVLLLFYYYSILL